MGKNQMPQRTIKKNRHAEPFSSGKYRNLDNYKMAIGMGADWIDQDQGIKYHIREYYDLIHDPKIKKSQKPTKIRISDVKTGKELGWVDDYIVQEKMKDPQPDPRY